MHISVSYHLMDEASDAFKMDRAELSDLVTELPNVSGGLAMDVLAKRLLKGKQHHESVKSLATDNTEAASYLLYLTTSSKIEDGVILMGSLIYQMMKSSGPLPTVTQEAIKEVEKHDHMNEEYYAFKAYDKIYAANPIIYQVIKSFSKETENAQKTIRVLALLYSAFEMQAELNKRKIY
jgi:hypothetical protein